MARRVTTNITVTPTISETVYSAGDCLGGKLSLPTSVAGEYDQYGSCYVDAIKITDKGGHATQIDVIVFADDPSNTTFADNSALSVSDSDLNKIAGGVSILNADYINMSDNSFAYLSKIGMPVFVPSTEVFYLCLIERGTPTRAVGDLSVTVGVVWLGIS